MVSLASRYQIAGLERAVAEVEEELLEQLFTDTLQKELDEKDETMELFETLSVGTIETDIDTDSIATEEDQEEKEWETYEDLVSEEDVKEWGTNRDLDMISKAAEAAEETEGEECGNCGCEACRDGQVGVKAPTQPTLTLLQVICSTLELEGKLGCQVSCLLSAVWYLMVGFCCYLRLSTLSCGLVSNHSMLVGRLDTTVCLILNNCNKVLIARLLICKQLFSLHKLPVQSVASVASLRCFKLSSITA